MVKSETQESNLLAFESIWSPTWDFIVWECPRETYIFEQNMMELKCYKYLQEKLN